MKKENVKRNLLFVVFLILTVVWMAVIFGFSANNAEESTIQSNTVTEFIIRIFNRDFDDMPAHEQLDLINSYDRVVRKCAHFIAYAVLGFLVYFTIAFATFLRCANEYQPIFLSVPVCVLFAATDEFHQTFVDGRAGRFSDVLIDSGGVVCGIVFALLVVAVVKRLKTNNKN